MANNDKNIGNRKGNALILVVGILVILVLVATAFITKTQSGRVTAAAQRIAASRNDSARVIGNSIADEIATSLFVRPLIPTTTNPQSANSRRGHPGTDWPRWGQDFNAPYNFAPYAVVPWTNPPDADDPINPDGIFDDNTDSYNPYGGPSFGDTRWLRDTEPGRADLFDQVGQGIDQFPEDELFGGYDGTPDIFTHWQHLTNLSRSGNAWRIVPDISDVSNEYGNGGLLEDLDIPVEQWPPLRPTRGTDFELVVHEGTGFPTINFFVGVIADNDPIELENYDATEFWSRWSSWFTLNFSFDFDDPDWSLAQDNQMLLPPNFLDLSNLDGDLYPLELGERAIDAYTPGTARWNVERILTDTDGDGFTDAFWHLSPFSPGPGLRQVVGISITDNSALLNANVATRFHRKDYYGTDSSTTSDLHGEATRGQTPADIALVAANENGFGNWRVGFLDSFANLPGNDNFNITSTWVRYPKLGQPTNDRVVVDWDFNQWQAQENASLLDELGVEVGGDIPNNLFTTANLNPTGDINSRYGRMWYWQLAGRQPFDATNGLRPYTLADELELRIANGNNYQFVGSRFERSLNNIQANTDQFLRSSMNDAHEAGEMRDQLDNRQLLFDNRRKLTLFSGTRNDLLPPWLRWDERFWQRYDPDDSDPLLYGYNVQNINEYQSSEIFYFSQIFPLRGFLEVVNAVNDDLPNALLITRNLAKRWREQASRKVDLREYYADASFGDPWWESNKDGLLTLAERAPLQLMLAMTNGQESGAGSIWDLGVPGQAASGNYDSGYLNDPLNNDEIGDTNFSNIKTNSYMQTRLMAAGLASNILAYRDEDDRWRQHSLFPFHYGNDEAAGVPRVLSDTPLSAAITPPVIGRQGNDPDTGPVAFASVPLYGPNGDNIRMLGLEAQPFILEVFIAHVHKADEWGDIVPRFRLLPEDSDVDADGELDCPQETVAVVQLANPFDREIDLTSYEVEFFGQLYPLSSLPISTLAPGTPNNPTTLILYSINPNSLIFKTDADTAEFQREWMDFLDIEPKNHPANTRLVEVGVDPNSLDPDPEYWRYDRAYYDALKVGEQNSVALYRWDVDFTNVVPSQFVLIDRLDAPDTLGTTFENRVVEEMASEWDNIPSPVDENQFYYVEKRLPQESPAPSAGDSLIYVQWDRATRAWGVDVPKYPENGGWHNEVYDPHERNPRYVFAAKDFTRTIDAANGEEIMSTEGTPDDPIGDITISQQVKYLTLFNWSTSLDPDDADLDGDTDGDGISEGSLDGTDADLLADTPDPWFTVKVWSPRAGELRPGLALPGDEGKVVGGLRQRKPTYFDMNHYEDPNNVLVDANGNQVEPRHRWSFPDKGWYGQTVNADDPNAPDDSDGTTSNDPAFSDNNSDTWITGDEWYMAQPFPMQMLQKDDDFDQVGELLNCWLFGHMLEGTYDLLEANSDELVLPLSHLQSGTAIDAGTVTTFSEFMYPAIVDADNDDVADDTDGDLRPDYNWWKPLVSITNPNQAYQDILFLDERVNRLRFMPGIDGIPQMLDGRSDSNAAINHPWPRLSIAARVLDSFVCDGPGRPDITGDGIGDDLNPSGNVQSWPSIHSFYNANNYSGNSTPGLININTAPLEVLRSLPHMYKTVHKTHENDTGSWVDQFDDQDYDYNTRTLLPESIIQWRERLNGFISHTGGTGVTGGPNYQWRAGGIGLDDDIGPDSVRGFSSPGELGMLVQSGNSFTLNDNLAVGVLEPWNIHIANPSPPDYPSLHTAIQYPEAWQSSFAAQDPFVIPHPDDVLDPLLVLESMGAHLSTDVNETTFSYAPPYNDTEGFRDTTAYEYYGLYPTIVGDGVSGDSEELNLLQSGISNLITTTSDMFTVHMRIRTFKRNSITGVWDATDLDNIIDDSRYVMLVDRSEVNTPADKPKILYFEKLPN